MARKNIFQPAFIFWLLTAAVFLIILIFNFLTPYLADDYTFAFSFENGKPITGPISAFVSQQAHYMHWSGRFVLKFLDQIFMSMPKAFFNLVNSILFAGLGLLLYLLCGGQFKKHQPVILLFIYLALWQFSPVFGQTTLWMCGSFNYLWATFFCICALIPYGLYVINPFSSSGWLTVLLFFAGLLAGWSSENTSAGLLVILVLVITFEHIYAKRIPHWMWAGLAGSLIGYILLVAAPGNYLRADSGEDSRSLITILAVRFLRAVEKLWDHALLLLILFMALYALLVLAGATARQLFWPMALLMGALGANFAMALSPVYYDRSTHGVLTFLILACSACLPPLRSSTFRKIFICSLAVLCLITFFQLIWASYDIACFSMMHHVRNRKIHDQQQAGSQTLVTYSIEPYTRWCSGYGLPDIQHDHNFWLNRDLSRYYGFDSTTATDGRTYPFPGFTNLAFETGDIAHP